MYIMYIVARDFQIQKSVSKSKCCFAAAWILFKVNSKQHTTHAHILLFCFKDKRGPILNSWIYCLLKADVVDCQIWILVTWPSSRTYFSSFLRVLLHLLFRLLLCLWSYRLNKFVGLFWTLLLHIFIPNLDMISLSWVCVENSKSRRFGESWVVKVSANFKSYDFFFFPRMESKKMCYCSKCLSLIRLWFELQILFC